MTKAATGSKSLKTQGTGRSLQKELPGSGKSSLITSAINMNEGAGEYIVYVAVPGMERKDFSVTIGNKILTVSAVKKEAIHCFSLYDEQAFPEWKETFTLPEDADTVMTAAVYRNGELEIHIPKGKGNGGSKPVDVYIY